jgi:hypothetical protein
MELKDALANPLLVWLLAEVYSGAADEPRELLEMTVPGSVETHLLRKLVPSAFDRARGIARPHGGKPEARIDGQQALATLSWLARREAPAICWWRLQYHMPRLGVILVTAVVGGTVIGYLARDTPAVSLLTASLILGAWFGVGFGRGYSSARMSRTMPSDRVGFGGKKEGEDPDMCSHLWRLGGAHLGAAAFWVTAQLAGWRGSYALLGNGTAAHQLYQARIFWSLVAAALACALIAFLGGHLLGLGLSSLGGTDVNQGAARAVTPRQALRRDALNTLKIAPIAYAICIAAVVSVFYPALQWHRTLIELATATTSLITYSLVFPAWVRYRVAHLYLVSFHRFPPFFIKFLEDAYFLGVVRQTGLSYQFRHGLLHRSLAGLHKTRPRPSRKG